MGPGRREEGIGIEAARVSKQEKAGEKTDRLIIRGRSRGGGGSSIERLHAFFCHGNSGHFGAQSQ